jgi:hypothetical protein
MTVTGAWEGGHSPGSAHEVGLAFDVGKNSNPGLTRSIAEKCFFRCFDKATCYAQEEDDHFHFQTRPGRGGAGGFATGVR